MKHLNTIGQSLLLICLALGISYNLRAEIPFLNDFISADPYRGEHQLLNTDEAFPFLGDMLRNRQNELFAGQLAMMDCFDSFTSGADNANVQFGDTVVLTATATNIDGSGANTNFSGLWYVADNSGGISDRGKFILPNGNPAPEFVPGSGLFQGSFAGMSDTILFLRDPADPQDDPVIEFQIVFQAQNPLNGNCQQRDTSLVRIDLEPNLQLVVDDGLNTDTLDVNPDSMNTMLSTAYCSGTLLDLTSIVINNPTTSGRPVFILTEVTDTSNQLGLAVLNGGVPLDGDTLYLTPNQLNLSPALLNNGDEDVFVELRLFPYYESDGTSTIPGTSTFTPGDDIIGDSIEFDFVVFSEPIASFGGNDTICYAADVPLDFTGTPNTRVYYRDTLTGVVDSVDLDAQGRFVQVFSGVTTDLFFVIDSLRRLDPPFCTASAATIAGIAPQPFIVTDSLVVAAATVDSIACDSFGFVSFDFVANDSGSVYSFLLTNSLDDFDSTYIAQGEDTLFINLSELNFGGVADTFITFYVSQVVDTSSTFNCANPALQDSFVVYIDTVPVLELTFGSQVDTSSNVPSLFDTICVTTPVNYTGIALSTAQSGLPMYVREIDSLYNFETGAVISVDTNFFAVADYNGNAILAAEDADTLVLVRTVLPYFESDASASMVNYNDDSECAGDLIRLEVMLTPVPLEPTVMFSTDSICPMESVDILLTGGTPGATVGYTIEGVIESTILDASGEATIPYIPMSDSGQVIVELEFTTATCPDLITGSDTVFVKPLPTGTITLSADSLCSGETVHVIFNTNSTFASPLNVRLLVREGDATTPNLQVIDGDFVDGDTIFSGAFTEDRAFILRRVRYVTGSLPRCPNIGLDTAIVRYEYEPVLEVDLTEVSVTNVPTQMTSAPDSIFAEVCAGDSIYLDYRLQMPDTSRFNDSVYLAFFITDPLGVTPAGPGTTVTYVDIDEVAGYDSLHLVNNTNDTARIEIVAVPFFADPAELAVDAAAAYAAACKGDSVEIQIDVINNFVTTIGGNYEVCFGADTIVVITGPDNAMVDYVAIYEVAPGDNDTSAVRTIQLDGQGRFEIVIDSIQQDTIYDLISATLPGSGCQANLGPNITVTVVPPPSVDFAMDSIEVCEGVSFTLELENGPELNGVARIYDSLGIDTFVVSLDAMGNASLPIDSILTSRKYYVDSIVYDNGMGLICQTDTIVDSIYVTVLEAPRLAITTDTVCFGTDAIITLVTTSTETFDLVIDSAGTDVLVSGVENGDVILTVDSLVVDSFRVILKSGMATTGNMCPAFPPTQFLDTAFIRIDSLPQLTVEYIEPFAFTINAASSPDTLVVCEGTVLTDTLFATPDTSIAGFGFALSTTITISDGTNSFTTPTLPVRPGDLQATMLSAPGFPGADSSIITFSGLPYFPSDTLPGGDPFPYVPGVDCAGDSVEFTLIILSTPTAGFEFGNDTICEDQTTSVTLMGSPGDTILFGVEGFGTTNIVLDGTGTFDYVMPTVAQFDSAIVSLGGTPDNSLVFAVLSANSDTDPSCTNNTPSFDTLTVERLPQVSVNVMDTMICAGSTAVIDFMGDAGDTAFVFLDYLADSLDRRDTVALDLSGMGQLSIPDFKDTVYVVLDTLKSNSGFGCVNTNMDTLTVIRTTPLPDGAFLVDTICNGETFFVIFNYTGDLALTSMDSFSISGLQPQPSGNPTAYNTIRTMNGDTIDFETFGPGSYTYTIESITNNTTGCTQTFAPPLEFTYVVEENPAYQIEFTGGVENGQIYDTDNPPTFPVPGTIASNVCSGTNLMTEIISSSTSSMGDDTRIQVTILNDDLALFNGLASPIDTTLDFIEFNELLINNTMSTQTVSFRVLPYYESGAATGLGVDDCTGGQLTFIFNVFPNPVAEFTNMDTMRICSGDSIYLNFAGSIGATVEFDDDDPLTPLPYSTTVGPDDSVKYVANQAGPDTVRFFITSVEQTFPGINQVCTGTSMDTVVLIVNPLPVPYLEFMDNDTVCFNETVEVVFRDTVGTGPWTVSVDGVEYTVDNDGDTLFTSNPITADQGFTIAAVTDANGCAADTISMNVVFTDTVRVEEVPLLTTDIEVLDFANISQNMDQLVDGLLELDTFCSLQRVEFLGTTSTSANLGGDPLYVQVAITGDVSAIWNGTYTGDTTFVVALADLPTALNSPLIPNSSASTLAAQIILTPYFETDVVMPGLDAGECGGAMDTLRLFIDPRPVAIDNTLEFEICSGDTFNFDLATNIQNLQTGSAFSYTVSSTGAATASDRPMPSADPISDVITNISLTLDTVTYTVVPFSPSGCEGDDFEVQVIVNPEPVLLTNSQTVCSREESMLRVNDDNNVVNPNRYIVQDVIYDTGALTGIDVIAVGDTFRRNNNDPSIDNIFIRDTYENVSADTQTVVYRLIPLVLSTGCTGDTVDFFLNVAPEPLVMNRDTVVCTDVRLNIDLQATVENGIATTFNWVAIAGDFSLIDGETTTLQIDSSFITDSLRLTTSAGTQQRQITYQVTALGENGCPISGPNTFLYTVFVSPNIQLTTSTPDGDFLCSGDPDGLSVVATASNTIGNVNYDWSIGSADPGVINPVIIDPTGNGSTINVNATGNGQFTVLLEVSDDGGCTAMSSTTITVYDELVPSFDTTYVGGNSATVDFTDTSIGFPTQWFWTFGDPASGSSDTSMVQNPTHTFSGPGTYDVTLRVIRQAFCPDTATVTQQVVIGFAPVNRCDTIILYPGFNVISLDVDSTDNSPAAIFADIEAFEPTPGNSNLNQVIGVHPDQSPSPLIYTQFFQTLTSIRPGFGYVVNVDVQDTLIVCGASIDPNLRVDIQSGFNVVGYVDDMPTSINSYFDSIIADGNMTSIQTYDMGVQQVWTPFFATLTEVKNGLGYVLDVSAAYTGNEWRDDTYTSSNFEYVYGNTTLGSDFAYQLVEALDADGNVMATFNLDENGNFGPEFLFGIVQDVNSHETFGIPQGTELRFRIGDRVSTNTHVFQGGWLGTELNIEFQDAVSSVSEQYETVRFRVFPNPARQLANVSFTTERTINNLRVDVINATGRMVDSQILENVTGTQTLDLNVGELPAGVYLVRLTGDGNFLGSDQLIIRR